MGLAGAGIAAALGRRGESARAERWRRRAEEAGLTEIETGSRFPFRAILNGRRGRHEVRIERYQRGKTKRGTRVVVRGLADAVSLRRENFGTTVEKTLGRREVEIGDGPFDAEVFVRGPEALLRALLDSETRRLLQTVFDGRIRMEPFAPRVVEMSADVDEGQLRSEFPDRFRGDDEPHTDTLRWLLAVAERLAPEVCLEARLAANARSDPHAVVRWHALGVLEREFPSSPETREATTAALGDADPEVRLRAALWLAEEGRPVLAELAASEGAPDSCSARAVAGLGEHLEPTLARSVLDVALRAGRLETAKASLAGLARGGAEHVDVIARALTDPRDEIATAAARALGDTSSALAEPPLLTALEQGTDPVRLAAAQSLGRVGTVRAVMPLKDAEEHGRRGVDKAAREAVVRIQSRLAGATPGQLALADDASGHVSLSDDSSGRVALSSDPPANGS